MKQPTWATRLLERICTEQEVPLPSIKWTRRQRKYSSGRYTFYNKHISINAGADSIDQRVVLLHEIAHYLHHLRTEGTGGHTALFWDIAFELFYDKRNRVKKNYALTRSTAYKAGAKQAYARLRSKSTS